MGFIRFLLWTGFSIGLGVFLAAYDVNGKTPLEYLQQAWPRNVKTVKLDKLKAGFHDTLQAAKDAVIPGTGKPNETHSPDERELVNKLIAKRTASR